MAEAGTPTLNDLKDALRDCSDETFIDAFLLSQNLRRKFDVMLAESEKDLDESQKTGPVETEYRFLSFQKLVFEIMQEAMETLKKNHPNYEYYSLNQIEQELTAIYFSICQRKQQHVLDQMMK